MQSKGFTLIEVLVVIGIVGLLASVVLVSMVGIRGKAQITKTLEFSQSLQHALGVYAVGIWSFDDQTNPTKDGSGYNNNGTLVNGPTFSPDTPHLAAGVGTDKYALSFDGVNDCVVALPNASLIGRVYSLELWLYARTVPAQRFLVVEGTGYYGLDIRADSFQFTVSTDGAWGNWWAGGDVGYAPPGGTIGKWFHIVATFDADAPSQNFKIYEGGILRNTANFTGTFSNRSPGSVGIGCMAWGTGGPTGYYYDGLIDEVRIYEKALTLGQIQKHYAEGLGKHLNLVIK